MSAVRFCLWPPLLPYLYISTFLSSKQLDCWNRTVPVRVIRTVPGAHPMGVLRTSKIVPDDFVCLWRPFLFPPVSNTRLPAECWALNVLLRQLDWLSTPNQQSNRQFIGTQHHQAFSSDDVYCINTPCISSLPALSHPNHM